MTIRSVLLSDWVREGMRNAQRQGMVWLFILFFCGIAASAAAQGLGNGALQGDVQIDAQWYREDSLIGAEKVPSKILANAYWNVAYVADHFRFGFRYEGYLGPLLGYPPQYAGQGIPYRFAEYRNSWLAVTVGNFYEQFGSGLVLRTYEERQLGIDNSLDGIRVKIFPYRSVRITGLIGKQRMFFETGEGIVRGLDLAGSLNDFVTLPFVVDIGISGVSKYQPDQIVLDPNDPKRKLRLPLNVLMAGVRMSAIFGDFQLFAEYAYKWNDPTAVNNFTYTPGEGWWLTASYAAKGIGVTASFKRIQNLDFRSDRNTRGNVLTLNYLPPLTRQHSYRLATHYPYATQPNGEVGVALDAFVTLPRKTLLGGRYGTEIEINFSRIHALDTHRLSPYRYTAPFPGFSDHLYYQELTVELSRKWTRNVKTVLMGIAQRYDKDVIEGVKGYGEVRTFVTVAELQYRIGRRDFLRVEAQHLWAKQVDEEREKRIDGNWAFGLVEYSIAPHWFFTITDEYNYGNPVVAKRIHYWTLSVAMVWGGFRVQLGYGKQRRGIVCVGGVCRTVPASNGAFLSLTGSF